MMCQAALLGVLPEAILIGAVLEVRAGQMLKTLSFKAFCSIEFCEFGVERWICVPRSPVICGTLSKGERQTRQHDGHSSL